MRQVGIAELKARLSEHLRAVRRGERQRGYAKMSGIAVEGADDLLALMETRSA